MKKIGLLLCLLVIAAGTLRAVEEYPLGPDSQRQPGVPQGAVTHYTWTSKIFPGTTRDYWVYVPAQYTPEKPACVMVFQDGEGFIKETGRSRVPIVFDNLIAKHEMPVTIGVFINPGILKALSPDQQNRYNRSFEYDALGDRYARFLLEEILPEVAKHYNLSTNPDDRAISGLSSGGSCAFNVAWNRPDAFHRVLSFIGSFTDLRGDDIYPALIRKTEPKPLRVFLQDGNHDLNLYAGSWWLANQSMNSALEYMGYDVKFVTGDKDHDMDQGGAILPDALRWLWRDYPKPITKPTPNHGGDPRTTILDPGHEWELVVPGGSQLTHALTVSAQGDVYYSSGAQNSVGVVGDRHFPFRSEGAAAGLAFGADGHAYACEDATKRIVAYPSMKGPRVIAEGVPCEGLVVTQGGGIYFTDPAGHRVWYINGNGAKHVVYDGLALPTGTALSPDQSLLFVSDPTSRWVWSFEVQADGSLANGEPFYRLETPDESSATGAAGMTVDTLGHLYVATRLGVQICDQPGRVVAIINPPNSDSLSGVTFGGSDFQDLYVVAGDKIFKRHLLRKGVRPGVPEKPPVPHL